MFLQLCSLKKSLHKLKIEKNIYYLSSHENHFDKEGLISDLDKIALSFKFNADRYHEDPKVAKSAPDPFERPKPPDPQT